VRAAGPDGAGGYAARVDRRLVAARVSEWYAGHARDLPWRAPGVTPWGVLVSEFMLQQTPAARVEPAWRSWVERWPAPADLAAEPPGEAVRAWGRLGYPRRAQRLHAASRAIVERFGGRVPADLDDLRSLPGVGEYTAAAVATFAFGRRHAVLDTNVRRVLARLDGGEAAPPGALGRAERERAIAWLPEEPPLAALWSVAAMELGAQVCLATASPVCGRCPVSDACAWRAAGYPARPGPPRRVQAYAGTDRQCRGALLAVLRDAEGAVPRRRVLDAWASEPDQAERALASLLADGLVTEDAAGLAL